MHLLRSAAILFFTVSVFASCSHDNENGTGKGADSIKPKPYYSVNDFIKDQWDMHYGQPYVLTKTAVLNGQKDSSLVAIGDMDWASIIKIFSATDISNKKFIGQYKVTEFENIASSRVVYFEANDPKLFTRVLELNYDPFDMRVRSIYIETAKHSFWSDKTQKLLYKPVKILQIQETEKPFIGAKKELKVTYRFPG